MALFKNQTHQDIWIEHHCGRCYYGRGLGDPAQPQCKILAWALGHGRKPVAWERNPRKNVLMQDSIKCNQETRTPPKFGGTRRVADEDVPMFDVAPPVDMDTEHA